MNQPQSRMMPWVLFFRPYWECFGLSWISNVLCNLQWNKQVELSIHKMYVEIRRVNLPDIQGCIFFQTFLELRLSVCLHPKYHNTSKRSSHNAKLPSGVYNAGHLHASSLDVCFANAGHWAWNCTDCDHIFEIWTLISKCRKLEDKNDDEEECSEPFSRSSLELNYSWRPWCVLWQPHPVWWSKCLRLHLIHSSCAHHCRERIWTCLWAAGPHQCHFDTPELKIVVELAPAP
jgi:hypothetical protein